MTQSTSQAPTQTNNSSAPAPSSATSAPTAGQPGGEQHAAPSDSAQPNAATTPAAPAGEQGGKPGEGESKPSEPAGAPESYAEFKLPEGVTISEGVSSAFTGFAKEMGMTQEAAQKFLDKMAPAMQANQTAMVESLQNEWIEAAKADKEIGGDKFDAANSAANAALNQFGTPELGALLTKSGLARNPEVIRFFSRVGQKISPETKFVTGGEGSQPTNMAQRMFPNMNP